MIFKLTTILNHLQSKRFIIFFSFLFFVTYFIIGLKTYKNYGIAWDEPASRNLGLMSTTYTNNLLGQPIKLNKSTEWDFSDCTCKTYGTFFETLLIAVEIKLNLWDNQDIFYMRHLSTFLFFYLSVIFFFLLVKERFDNIKYALLGSLFLVLSPRIYGDSFYNSKDVILLSAFIIGSYTLLKLFKKPTISIAFFHALVCAICIDIRIVGIVIPLITFFFLFLKLFRDGFSIANIKQFIIISSTFGLCLIIFTIAFWPYLWTDPIVNFLNSFKSMSKYAWDNHVLFMGEYIPVNDLPFYYIPLFLIITSPILYVFLFLIGLFANVKKWFSFKLSDNNFYDLIFLTLCVLPVAIIIILNSVVYNGWRHLFFIYPAFLMISLTGVEFLLSIFNHIKENKKHVLISISFGVIIIFNIFYIGYWMVKNHPNQNVYFNVLANKSADKYFELDYWGLSYKQGLEYLIKKSKDSVIYFNSETDPAISNTYLIDINQRRRLRFTNSDTAQYFLTTYFICEGSKGVILKKKKNIEENRYPYINQVFSVSVDGNKILGVYKLK